MWQITFGWFDCIKAVEENLMQTSVLDALSLFFTRGICFKLNLVMYEVICDLLYKDQTTIVFAIEQRMNLLSAHLS